MTRTRVLIVCVVFAVLSIGAFYAVLGGVGNGIKWNNFQEQLRSGLGDGFRLLEERNSSDDGHVPWPVFDHLLHILRKRDSLPMSFGMQTGIDLYRAGRPDHPVVTFFVRISDDHLVCIDVRYSAKNRDEAKALHAALKKVFPREYITLQSE